MHRTTRRSILFALTLATTSVVVAAGTPNEPASSSVKVSEEKISIPTYLLGEPDPNPQFYFGGQSQGAQHRIYPYPAYDNLTTEKQSKTYTMVYLENEYVKIGILPEIGGKIFEAIDKTNGYDFIYHQHVIKPALISLLGAWISGGIEWDIPHHHRATSFLPMQYKVEPNPDGSKTVWVGELELRDRMEWTVGLTLHPGKSYLQASFRMINRTPVPTSMLSFSNVAVHVNDSYQVIYPPSTQFVTYHFKRDFTTWPIATTKFMGADYTAGVDVSLVQKPRHRQLHVRLELHRRLHGRIRPRQERRHHEHCRPQRRPRQKVLDLGQRSQRPRRRPPTSPTPTAPTSNSWSAPIPTISPTTAGSNPARHASGTSTGIPSATSMASRTPISTPPSTST
jgi:hypothetical protein